MVDFSPMEESIGKAGVYFEYVRSKSATHFVHTSSKLSGVRFQIRPFYLGRPTIGLSESL